jgi:hypothetical protein
VGSWSGAVDDRADVEATLTDLHGRCLTAVDCWDVHDIGPEPAEWDHRERRVHGEHGPVVFAR